MSSGGKKKYTNHGYTKNSRVWLGGRLAKHRTAFTLYAHLVGWANYENGKLKRGQLAIGERDFGARLGMSITTVRRWLRWLRNEGWITLKPTRHGAVRGTIVTVIHYDVSEDGRTYKYSAEDQEMILVPIQSEDQKVIHKPATEDQSAILKPRIEDHKMIPQVLIENSYEAHEGDSPVSRSAAEAKSGLRLPAENFPRRCIAELHAKLDGIDRATAAKSLQGKKGRRTTTV